MFKYKEKIFVLMVSLGLPLLMSCILLSWHYRLAPGDHMWGIFQGDMATYVTNAKTTNPSTLHLTYGSPFDLKESKDYYLVQLPITLLSYLLQVGLSPEVSSLMLTLVFGTCVFWCLYKILELLVEDRHSRLILFLLISMGGGLAWVSSLSDQNVALGDGIRFAEKNYYWWFFNLFRNLFYPFELIHHTIFFIYLLNLMKKKWREANMLVILSMLINPFLTVHMILVQLIVGVFDRGTPFKLKYFFIPFALCWAVYYKFLLPMSPIFGSLIEQHKGAFQESMELGDLFQAYGFSIVGLLSIFDRKYIRKIKTEWMMIPVITLTFVTLVLVNNSRLPFIEGIQPLHFARGYLFVGLWIMTFKWLEFCVEENRIKKFFFRNLVYLFFVMSLPDNISFLHDMYAIQPTKDLLTWDNSKNEMINFLKGIPKKENIIAIDFGINRQIAAMTQHQVLFGTLFITPDFSTRFSDTMNYVKTGGVVVPHSYFSYWRVDKVILPNYEKIINLFDRSKWPMVWESKEWVILENNN